MSDREDYERLLDKTKAVPDEKEIAPNVVVEIMAREAEMKHNWALEDEERFKAINFKWSIVMSLPALCGAARYAEVLWRNKRLAQEDAQQLWEKERLEGYELRDDMLAAEEYAFDDDEDLMQRLDEIQEGDSHVDKVQDILALATLGLENKDKMEAAGYPIEKLHRAEKIAARLSELMADADVANLKDSEEKNIRDKAYTRLVLALRKVCKGGKYACRGLPDRLKGYLLQYRHRNYVRQRNVKREQEEAAATM